MIEFQTISRSFGTVRVLRDVTFTVQPGHLVGLVGENGAGKSTLMNIVGGVLQPDTGTMRLGGKPYAPRDPVEATRHGVAFIHQELNLFPNLSIAENIFLTSFPLRGKVVIDRGEARRRAAASLREVGLELDPDTKVEHLPAGERQLVEVAKALSVNARLLLFDEPTTSLTTPEAERLFQLIERLRARGLSLVYISHTLPDVLRLSAEIVVLRDGEIVASGPRAEFTHDRLVSLMVGRSLNQLYPGRSGQPGSKVLLEAKRLSQPGVIRKVSFRLHEGEVLGLSGLMGAGRSELARILFGLDGCRHGELFFAGSSLRGKGVRARIGDGLALLTEDRRADGLCLDANIAENVSLASLGQHAKPASGWLNLASIREAVASIRKAVRLTSSAPGDMPVRNLSGGNQQKVVLAKWLLARPRVLLLDEPTRGIDVGAKFEIYQLIHELADNGAGVLVISSELEELLGICDRILVMSKGELRDELRRDQFDRERIMRAALQGAISDLAPSAPEPR
jgi:ribose transport system ATP-binding protein